MEVLNLKYMKVVESYALVILDKVEVVEDFALIYISDEAKLQR